MHYYHGCVALNYFLLSSIRGPAAIIHVPRLSFFIVIDTDTLSLSKPSLYLKLWSRNPRVSSIPIALRWAPYSFNPSDLWPLSGENAVGLRSPFDHVRRLREGKRVWLRSKGIFFSLHLIFNSVGFLYGLIDVLALVQILITLFCNRLICVVLCWCRSEAIRSFFFLFLNLLNASFCYCWGWWICAVLWNSHWNVLGIWI